MLAVRWTAERLARIEAGVQPVQDGRLLCRYCGRWFRSLGHHLVGPAHGTTPQAYREQFELPATAPLMAADLRKNLAERGRERFEDPAVRAAFAVDQPYHPERERRRRRGLQRKAETEARAGVQRSKQAVGAMLGDNSRSRAAQRRRDLDKRARSLGYDDLHHLLHTTTELTHPELGELMGWEPDTAKMWRDLHAVRSDAKAAAARHRAAQQAAADDPPDAERTGTQPAEDDGRLRCLECGTAWDDLGKHVEHTHRMAQATYRRHHRLPADCPLHSAQLDQRKRDAMAAVGRASGQARRDRFRARYDELARAAGYTDVQHLLTDCSNKVAAQLLVLNWETSAARLRRKYVPDAPAPAADPARGEV